MIVILVDEELEVEKLEVTPSIDPGGVPAAQGIDNRLTTGTIAAFFTLCMSRFRTTHVVLPKLVAWFRTAKTSGISNNTPRFERKLTSSTSMAIAGRGNIRECGLLDLQLVQLPASEILIVPRRRREPSLRTASMVTLAWKDTQFGGVSGMSFTET